MLKASLTPFLRYPIRSFLKQTNGNCKNNFLEPHRNIYCLSGVKKQLVCGNEGDYRKSIAPWLKFGEYEKGLMSHLSNYEIIRALFVLHLCSFDYVVDKSTQLLDVSKRFGKIAEVLIRKTFYDQFVGGDEIPRMAKVVDLLHRRGLTLMVAPVLEEDVEDEKASMKVYNENLASLKGIAEMTSSLDKDDPVVQLKLTAIMPAKTLEHFNKVIKSAWETPSRLAKLLEEGAKFDSNQNLSFFSGSAREDRDHFLNGLKRADEFVNFSNRLGVKVLVDAEFYDCQAAISTVALILMARYNGEGYVVGDTIQGYLKDSHQSLSMELEVTEKLLGVAWFAKIVRGAYMDRERILARKNGKPSPICESYEETSQSYDRCIETVLRYLVDAKKMKPHLLIASHNEKSIRLAVQHMKDLKIGCKDGLASFAQIYGMADYLSSPLVKSEYKVYKSTPYGPITKVVPYLARRASENRSVLKGAREEKIMLKKELFSRIFSN